MGFGGLLEASWSSQSRLVGEGRASRGECGALGAEKSSLDRVLAAPRPLPREVSANLEAKRPPKGRPRGCKIESKRRLKLKMRIILKLLFFNRIH